MEKNSWVIWGGGTLTKDNTTSNNNIKFIQTGVTVSFFPPPVFPRGRIRPAHFFPGEETG